MSEETAGRSCQILFILCLLAFHNFSATGEYLVQIYFKYTKCSFSIKVNVREEMEEFIPRMLKRKQDKRRLMKNVKDQKISIEWGKKIIRRLFR